MNCPNCYDWLLGPLERRFLAACRFNLCSPLQGQVVEVGAGTGLNLPYYGRQCQVLALEPHDGMRKCAEGRCRHLDRSNIRISSAAAEEIPLPTGTVDHWVSTLVLCSVQDVGRVLAEARRVLKPTGQIHLLEHGRGQGAWGVIHDWLTPAWSWLSGGCHLNRQPQRSLQGAGFEAVGWQPVATVAGVPFFMGGGRLAGSSRSATGARGIKPL